MALNIMDAMSTDFKTNGLASTMHQPINFTTGLDILDYANGYVDEETGKLHLGVREGRIWTALGPSGSGKTTILDQVACHIVGGIPNACAFKLDLERACSPVRIRKLAGWTETKYEEKYKLYTADLNTDSIYSMIHRTAEFKRLNREELLFDHVDVNGDTHRILPPTIFIIDSWAMMMPKDKTEAEDLGTAMDPGMIAKHNNAFIKRVINDLAETNIHLFIINHITTAITLNAQMQPLKTQIQFLKKGESAPGGSSACFLADFFIRVEGGTQYKVEEGFKIKGFPVKMTVIKSRGNEAGKDYHLVFEQAKGFCNILSNYELLMTNKLIKGAGRGYYLESKPDTKFAKATFRKKYLADPEFADAVNEAVDNLLIAALPCTGGATEEQETEEYVEVKDTTPKKKKR